ncbi:MAG: phosphatase PAP2 family protein [Myxococcota bacterium]|jgi:membrane-associated phospholipid phosphatase|nr:phosphatase PAP2 family protein [Myxococcota bacterium]
MAEQELPKHLEHQSNSTVCPAPSMGLGSSLQALGALVHLVALAAFATVRIEHVIVDAAVFVLALWGPRTRALLWALWPLWLTGVLMDSQPFFVPQWRGEIHTGELWAADARLFPAPDGSPWPAWWQTRTSALADLLCGLAYMLYLLEYFGLAVYLWWRKDELFRSFTWGFFVLSLLAVAVYMLYPAAPPWYVMDYGAGPAQLDALPSAAGAARFDSLLGVHFFAQFYSRNPNVFGAMPSLHVATPALAAVLLWGRGKVLRWASIGFTLWVAFSALYLAHHYVLDVLAGALLAIVSALVVRRLLREPHRLEAEGTVRR